VNESADLGLTLFLPLASVTETLERQSKAFHSVFQPLPDSPDINFGKPKRQSFVDRLYEQEPEES